MLDRKLTTEAAVNRDAGERDVALLKAFMGMVESWELHNAPPEAHSAFIRAIHALWAEGKRTKRRPRLERERLPGAELLLKHRLAFEVEGGIEIPCVTEGWEAIENHRERGKKGGRGKLSLSSAKAELSPPENTEFSRGTNGTDPALRARKILDPKILRVRTKQKVRRKEAHEERLLFDSQETSTTAIATSRFRATELPGFDRFWAAYPQRRDKPAALAMWQKLGCEAFVDLVVSKVELLKREDSHWHRGFVKWPHRWLRAEGWSDDPVPEPVERLPPRHLTAGERQMEVIRQSDELIAKIVEEHGGPLRSKSHH